MQIVATGLYKVPYGLAPHITNENLKTKNVTYNLRNDALFITRNIKSLHYDLEAKFFLDPKKESLPKNVKMISKILTSSNQIFNFRNLRTVDVVSSKFV